MGSCEVTPNPFVSTATTKSLAKIAESALDSVLSVTTTQIEILCSLNENGTPEYWQSGEKLNVTPTLSHYVPRGCTSEKPESPARSAAENTTATKWASFALKVINATVAFAKSALAFVLWNTSGRTPNRDALMPWLAITGAKSKDSSSPARARLALGARLIENAIESYERSIRLVGALESLAEEAHILPRSGVLSSKRTSTSALIADSMENSRRTISNLSSWAEAISLGIFNLSAGHATPARAQS